MDRVEEWRLFAAAARLESFSRAAKTNGRSPQAVTRAIAALERRVGARLFHRTTRTVTLTDDGRRYLDRCLRVIAEVDALEAPASARVAIEGVVSITAPVLFGQMHVAPVVAAFAAEHPGVEARLLLLDRVVSLAEEGIDVAVRIGAPADSALRSRLVGHVRSVVVASPAYLERAGTPRRPDDLERHDAIVFTGTTPIAARWSFARRGGRRVSVRVRPRLVVNDGRAAIDAARAGLGVVRVLGYQVDDLVRRGALRVLLEPYEDAPAPIYLLQLPGVASRAAAAFTDLAAARLTSKK